MNKSLIYDIGMHNGDDTAYYLSLGYNVVAVDASPDLVKAAETRFKKEIAEKKLDILNVGIASSEGYLDFYLNKHNSVWNSFDRNIGTREGSDSDIIKVRTLRADQLVREKGVPYYMKIDIEGQDLACLASLQGNAEKPLFVSAEVNDLNVINEVKNLGYNRFKIIHQASLLPLELPALKEYNVYHRHVRFQTSRNIFVRVIRKLFGSQINRSFESKYKHVFRYEHPYGSSGPFGNNLPGTWKKFDEVMEIYNHYKSAHNNSSTNTGYNYWIDVHATTV